MSRSRQYKSNFSAGVISPEAEARIDSNAYNSGLSVGKNILIQTAGGMTRRPGTKFIRTYGALAYVRIFPFIFNTDQKYVIVMRLETEGTAGFIDIYRDDALVFFDLAVPYKTKLEMLEVDFAQSADSMIMTHGNYPPQQLRRKGSDTDWDVIPAPIINPPCDSMMCEDDLNPGNYVDPTCVDGSTPYCGTGKCLDDSEPTCPADHSLVTFYTWSDTSGYPKHCTFHQGRLWFAGCKTQPQSVWGSKVQDFFNFDVGIGDPADSIHETLDTDFINPIMNIYSAGKLQVYTSGAEFVNGAQVITPTTSSWARQTTYGSSKSVRPISVDGSTLFLDNTEKTIRQFTYVDGIKGYDAPSISSDSDHLIKAPVAMGAMRGDVQEASNLIYVVNADGTMAVLNLSKAYQMNAWTEWNTQGFYKQVMDLDRELYILVERYADNAGVLELHWFLERVEKQYLTDSGNLIHSLSESSVETIGKDSDNFFGVYYAPHSSQGKVVIVEGGAIVYQTNYLKDYPLERVRNVEDVQYSAGRVFDTNETVRGKYYDEEAGYRWYMHTMSAIQLENNAKNYIDGLTHLVNQSVVAVLDGSVYDDLIATIGEPFETVDNTFPDGPVWLYDDTAGNETFLRRYALDDSTLAWEGFYQGTFYPLLEETEWGLLISGLVGEGGSEYLQIGVEVDSINHGSRIDITADGSYTAGTSFPSNTEITVTAIGGGGGGGGGACGRDGFADVDGEGGGASNSPAIIGETATTDFNFTIGDVMDITIGNGGGGGAGGVNENAGGAGITGGTTSIATAIVLSALGGGGAPGGAGMASGSRGENGPAGLAGVSTEVSSARGGDGLEDSDGGDKGIGGAGASGYGASGGCGGGGGGGEGHFTNPGVGENGGAGGAGATGASIIEWSGTFRIKKYRTRKMALVSVTVTEGVVYFPDNPYTVGEAGLFFDMQAVTLPLNVSAGGGSLVNEPKRVVSVTSKFVDTQGVSINGVSIPERRFGEVVLDEAPPLLTGIDKIRLLGYTRDTRIYISQDSPMPMTLLSLDIEVNY